MVMAQAMAPWLQASFSTRWTIAGDHESFADAWRYRVEMHFPA